MVIGRGRSGPLRRRPTARAIGPGKQSAGTVDVREALLLGIELERSAQLHRNISGLERLGLGRFPGGLIHFLHLLQ